MTTKEQKEKILDEILGQSQVQLNVRIPVRLRVRMEEFLQYQERPLADRIPESEDWPTSMQALVKAAVEDYLARRPLKTRTGSNKSRKPKPEVRPRNIIPAPNSQEAIAQRRQEEKKRQAEEARRIQEERGHT